MNLDSRHKNQNLFRYSGGTLSRLQANEYEIDWLILTKNAVQWGRLILPVPVDESHDLYSSF